MERAGTSAVVGARARLGAAEATGALLEPRDVGADGGVDDVEQREAVRVAAPVQCGRRVDDLVAVVPLEVRDDRDHGAGREAGTDEREEELAGAEGDEQQVEGGHDHPDGHQAEEELRRQRGSACEHGRPPLAMSSLFA